MKSVLRLAILTAGISFAFIGSTFAQCYSPDDIGTTTYQVQSVNAHINGDKYTLQLSIVNLICVENHGYYQLRTRKALDPVTRRAMDGSLYTVKSLSGEAMLTTEAYMPIQTSVIDNSEYQTFVFKFSVKEVFGSSRQVRLRYFRRFVEEITHGDKIIRPTPASSGEVYIDITR